MAEVKKGDNCCWGTGVTTTTSYGRITGCTRTKGAEKTKIMDEKGDVVTKIYHGHEDIFDIEITVTAATYSTPTIGQTIVVADSKGDGEGSYWHVDSMGDTQSNSDVTKIKLTLSSSPGITN